MKKTAVSAWIFSAAAVAVFLAGIVHTAIAYAGMLKSLSSAPAEVALLVFVPYAFGLCVMFAIRAVWRAVKKRRNRKNAAFVLENKEKE